ncbi:MAG: hypothetical protein IJG85_00650 [Eubacteriaceae bacterium]|nr:hypothetical protein [Eubacteriaceae bacterium]
MRVDGGALGCVCPGGERGKERGEHTAADHCARANPDAGDHRARGGADTGRTDGDAFTGAHYDCARADAKSTGGDTSGISG